MALAYDATLQDRIAQRAFRSSYSSLSTRDKNLIDGSWTMGAPGGEAGAAIEEIRPTAQYLDVIGTGDIPSEFATWFVDLAVYRVVLATQGAQEASELRRQVSRSRMNAVAYFARLPLSDTAGGSLATTRADIVRHVVQGMFQGSRLVAPAIEQIDRAIRDTITFIWTQRPWSFARHPATATLATDGTVTFSDLPAGASFDFSLLPRWRYEDASVTGSNFYLTGASAQQMAASKAIQLDAGRPSLIRHTRYGNTDRWELDRLPDQEYTLHTEVRIQRPALATIANIDTALGLFPDEFHEIIYDHVLARCKAMHPDMASDGMRLRREADDRLAMLGPLHDDGGRLDEVDDRPGGGIAGTAHPSDVLGAYPDGFGQIGGPL